jgi:hypothetical protein
MLLLASSTVATINDASSMSRLSKSMKNEAFFFEIGPPKLPPYWRVWIAGRLSAKGLRALSASSLKLKETWPRKRSVPGFVRISIRPRPSRSY